MSYRIHDKYWKIVLQVIKESDVILYVADARFPTISRHKSLERKIIENPEKGFVLVLNKQDLVPRSAVDKWRNLIHKEGITVASTSARERYGTSIVRRKIMTVAPKSWVKVGVVGVPNTGKSSLINVFKGRKSAPTSSIPGHTKAKQYIKTSKKVYVNDTPGVVDRDLSDNARLVLGTIRVESMSDVYGSACDLIALLEKMNEDVFRENFTFSYQDEEDFIEQYARFRNKLLKGGRLDVEAGARLFLQDYIQGKLKIWEKPPGVESA